MFGLFKEKIRTRFAPSPTGYLHIGGLRTALYAYLWAKKNGGVFYLRIEDTDQTREVPNAAANLVKILAWAGLDPDEGLIDAGGDKTREKGRFGPYTQSQRLSIYQKYAKELISKNLAYYCFCTPERLEELRQNQEAKKQPTKYDGHCRNLSKDEIEKKIAAGDKYVIRMRIPEDEVIEFNDLVRGKIKVQSKEIDDQVLLKADGFPTYHLAHVVDDYLMKTSLIIRGEEWLPSTPKHLLLFKYLGWKAPQYAHLSLILNPDKTKLSKRQGDVAVEDYKAKGYLPEALINYVALLGWNPGTEQEIFSLPELIKEFSFDKVHKAGAVFDLKKLNWMNGEYIKKMSLADFTKAALPFLKKNIGDIAENSDLEKILRIEQERISNLSETGESVKFLFANELEYEAETLIWKKSNAEGAKTALGLLAKKLSDCDGWTKEKLEQSLIEFIKNEKMTNGEALWPLRVALTGQEKSPTPFEVAEILGKAKTIERINKAISKLNG